MFRFQREKAKLTAAEINRWNKFADLAQRQGQAKPPGARDYNPNSRVVPVKNTSGSDRAAFECMSIDSMLWDLETDGSNAVVFDVKTADPEKPPAILLGPIANNATGMAVVDGMALALVSGGSGNYATPDATNHNLEPASSGSIRLLTEPHATNDRLLAVVLNVGQPAEGIQIRNDTGADLSKYDVVSLGAPVSGFSHTSVPVYKTATANNRWLPVAVCQADILDGETGPVVIEGTTLAKVQASSDGEDQKFAYLDAGANNLIPSFAGNVQLLETVPTSAGLYTQLVSVNTTDLHGAVSFTFVPVDGSNNNYYASSTSTAYANFTAASGLASDYMGISAVARTSGPASAETIEILRPGYYFVDIDWLIDATGVTVPVDVKTQISVTSFKGTHTGGGLREYHTIGKVNGGHDYHFHTRYYLRCQAPTPTVPFELDVRIAAAVYSAGSLIGGSDTLQSNIEGSGKVTIQLAQPLHPQTDDPNA